MPTNHHEIVQARMAVKDLLKKCDTYLEHKNTDRGMERPVTRLRDLFRRLGANDYDALNYLPEHLVEEIKAHARIGNDAFDYAIEITDVGIGTVRSDGAAGIFSAYDNAFGSIVSVSCFGISPAVMNDLEKNAKETVAKFEKDAAQAIETINKAGQDANSVLQKAREAASAEGVSQHAKTFQDEANNCRKIADIWLAMAIVVIGAFAWAGYQLIPEEFPTDNIWFFAITRGVLFSAIVYALFFCVKNYMINKHNYVVNRHRQNALQTYQALVGAAASAEVQDIVLTHAARCIFEQRDTGYVKSGSNNEGGNVVNFSPVKAAQKVMESAD